MPYTLNALPIQQECCPCPTASEQMLKFDPIGTVSSAISVVGNTLSTVKKVAIGTAVAIGFLVIWNVFVK